MTTTNFQWCHGMRVSLASVDRFVLPITSVLVNPFYIWNIGFKGKSHNSNLPIIISKNFLCKWRCLELLISRKKKGVIDLVLEFWRQNINQERYCCMVLLLFHLSPKLRQSVNSNVVCVIQKDDECRKNYKRCYYLTIRG